MKQNITLSLDTNVLKQAKQLAAKKHQSISRFLADELASRVEADRKYEMHMRQALALMEKGFDLGGGPYLTREQAHARR